MKGILLRWLPDTRTVDSVNIIKQLIYYNIRFIFLPETANTTTFLQVTKVLQCTCALCACVSHSTGFSSKLLDNALNQSTSVNNSYGKDDDNLNRTKKLYLGQEICNHLSIKEREVNLG